MDAARAGEGLYHSSDIILPVLPAAQLKTSVVAITDTPL